MAVEERLDEEEAQALKELVEVAVELKKTGLLGMLKDLLSDSEGAFSAILVDPSTFRLLALIAAVLEASRRIDGSQVAGVKNCVENAFYCLLDGMAKTDPAKAERRGLTGLMSALRDPDVQKGLGFVMALAKNLGACLRRLEGSTES